MSHLARIPSACANTWVTRLNPSSENIKWPLCSPLTSSGERPSACACFSRPGLLTSPWPSQTHTCARCQSGSSGRGGDARKRQRSARTLHLSCAGGPGNRPSPRHPASPPFPYASSRLPGSYHQVLFSRVGPRDAEINGIETTHPWSWQARQSSRESCLQP